jgi:hypothetical protein
VRAPASRTVSADRPARKTTTRPPARTTAGAKRKTPVKSAPRAAPRGRAGGRRPTSRSRPRR